MEQREDAAKREHIQKMAMKDWNRDFGHCFPDLMEGIDKELAQLPAQGDTPTLINGSHSVTPGPNPDHNCSVTLALTLIAAALRRWPLALITVTLSQKALTLIMATLVALSLALIAAAVCRWAMTSCHHNLHYTSNSAGGTSIMLSPLPPVTPSSASVAQSSSNHRSQSVTPGPNPTLTNRSHTATLHHNPNHSDSEPQSPNPNHGSWPLCSTDSATEPSPNCSCCVSLGHDLMPSQRALHIELCRWHIDHAVTASTCDPQLSWCGTEFL